MTNLLVTFSARKLNTTKLPLCLLCHYSPIRTAFLISNLWPPEKSRSLRFGSALPSVSQCFMAGRVSSPTPFSHGSISRLMSRSPHGKPVENIAAFVCLFAGCLLLSSPSCTSWRSLLQLSMGCNDREMGVVTISAFF